MQATASGELGRTPLAHLIVYCAEKKLKGSLVLRPAADDDPAHADVITLSNGLPAKIRVADPVEYLGRILVEMGAIDDATYNESLLELGRGRELQGQILLRKGKIDGKKLDQGLRLQIRRKLGYLFQRPESTTYDFYEDADFLTRYGGPELHPVDASAIVLTGVRARPSLPHMQATLDRIAGAALRIKPGANLASFEPTRSERDLLDLLKVSPMTAEQLAASGVADERTARVLLYGLLLLKQIEALPQPKVITPATTPVVRVPKALDRNPSPVVARVALKRIPSSAGQIIETGGGDGRDEDAPPSSRGRKAQAARDPNDPRRLEIHAKLGTVTKENYFQILDIANGASAEEAKSAYFQLAKRWHPDRLPPELADLRDQVASVFAHMNEAYQTLTDQDRRLRYLKVMEQGGGTPEDQAEVARVMEASNAFQKAEFYVNKNLLSEAEPFAKKAFELEPGAADHVAVWCWIQSHKPERRQSGKYDDLLLKLDVALADAPKSERTRFYRGMILKAAGRVNDAMRDFRDVAEANPRHVEAAREVRLYTMRQENERKSKDEGGGGLLGRFMKKK